MFLSEIFVFQNSKTRKFWLKINHLNESICHDVIYIVISSEFTNLYKYTENIDSRFFRNTSADILEIYSIMLKFETANNFIMHVASRIYVFNMST